MTFTEPRKAHPISILFSVLELGRSGIWVIFALMVMGIEFGVLNLAFGVLNLTLLAGGFILIAGGAIVLVAVRVVSWFRFTFRIEGDTFCVEQGVIFRRSIRLSGERIQAIDSDAKLLHRLFGVTKLNVHTAGAMGAAEVSIPALALEEAEELTRALRGLRAASRLSDASEVTNDVSGILIPARTSSAAAADEHRELPSWSLDSHQLALVAVTADFWPVYGAFITAVGAGLAYLPLERMAGVPGVPDVFAMIISLMIPFLIVAAWLSNAVSTGVKFWGFTVTRDKDAIHTQYGLLRRQERNIPLRRIQAIRHFETIPAQALSRSLIMADSAGVVIEERSFHSAVLHPLLTREEMPAFCDAIAPGHTLPALGGLPRRSIIRYVWIVASPVMLIAIALALWLPYGWIALPLPVLPGLWGYLMYRDAAWGVSETVLGIRRRLLNRTTFAIRRSRIQSIRITQNPFQKWAGLATVRVAVASVPLTTIWHIDYRDAWRLFEWVSRPAAALAPQVPSMSESS